MKILFDHQIFYQTLGGASKYFVMMLNELPADMWETTTLLSCNEYVKEKKTFPYVGLHFKGQYSLLKYCLNPIYTNYRLRKGNFDVFHQTDYNPSYFNSLGLKPMVITFHDANQALYDPVPKVLEYQKKTIKRADAIIAISENTKQDLVDIFGVDEKKVTVIYHGIEKTDLTVLPSERYIKEPYILYVGRRSEYKNFHRFVEAFSLLHVTYPEIKVICTSKSFTQEEIQMFDRLHITDRMISIVANETMMKQLYRDAIFFIFPSVYEGFGMPILEAWSCNCPVLLSQASCFPEIAGKAGLYFNPMDVEDIYMQMEKIIINADLRSQLVQLGNERVNSFSWKTCADQHVKLYQSLI
ncbi:glycosyltransferase family 4 protein [Phocaeicola sartorii]|jgi:glycosyltransferase involved in cell wall biosynthesis|uniref:glycosyltransferase family 4 protein n=1 Tax=Phocaeicola sartorii TaxID=671267 RepID=UPI003510E325